MSWFAVFELDGASLIALSFIVLLAGVIRGFSGFALSAVTMVLGVSILSPIELIPICFWLEVMASLMMLKQGWAQAQRRTVAILAVTSAIAVVFGLLLTMAISVELSRLVALSVIAILAMALLLKINLSRLHTTLGTALMGAGAGLATGLASVGGMVVALYMLSSTAPAVVIRASLVLYLAASEVFSMAALLLTGVMDLTASWRALALMPAVILGIGVGKALFRPRWEPYYRPFCLALLLVLAVWGLLRMLLWS